MADLSSPQLDAVSEHGANRAVTRSHAPPKRGLRRTLARVWRLLRGGKQSRARTALAVALGIFIGCLPLYGLHFPICLVLCLALRLDFVLTYLAANISNPFVAPFLVTLEVEVGSLLLTGDHAAFTLERAKSVGITGFVLQAAVGGVVVGAALAAVGAGLTYAVARRNAASNLDEESDDPLESAMLRTIERYRRASLGDRLYVASKLRYDPLLSRIAESNLNLGRVIDAGAGRGQFSLCLLELGRAHEVIGFDFDARKVNVARNAAGANARFEFGDLTSANFDSADSILLIDVLHYLPLEEQNSVLRRAVYSLVKGGRLLIREVDAVPGYRSSITRFFERIATRIGYNRARQELSYRTRADIEAFLATLGCKCNSLTTSDGTPFANVLIVAERT